MSTALLGSNYIDLYMMLACSYILIGISEKEFVFNKQLGASKKSYGYKSDGKVYHGKSTGEDYGPKFERHDTVGCGVLLSRREIFFTLNGRYLGIAFANIDVT